MIALLKWLHHGWLAHLQQLRSEGVGVSTAGVNAKGDRQRHFDVAADRWVRSWLMEHCASGVVESEEEAVPFTPRPHDPGRCSDERIG